MSNWKSDNTFALITFENKQLWCSAKKIFKSKLIHLMTVSFSDCWIYQENKQFFRRWLFLIKYLKINPYSIILIILHTFGGIFWFLKPKMVSASGGFTINFTIEFLIFLVCFFTFLRILKINIFVSSKAK